MERGVMKLKRNNIKGLVSVEMTRSFDRAMSKYTRPYPENPGEFKVSKKRLKTTIKILNSRIENSIKKGKVVIPFFVHSSGEHIAKELKVVDSLNYKWFGIWPKIEICAAGPVSFLNIHTISITTEAYKTIKEIPFEDLQILVVDDIYDSGVTACCVRATFSSQGFFQKTNTENQPEMIFASAVKRRYRDAFNGEQYPLHGTPFTRLVYGERISTPHYIKMPWEK